MTVKNPWASRIVGHAEVAPSGRPLGARRENGAPRKIRTSDLQIRSLLLYPAELGAHSGTQRNPNAIAQAAVRQAGA